MKKKIIIFTGYYIPSIKGGGPIQSIKNLVGNLNDKFEFLIVTSDRDLGDTQPFHKVKTDTWSRVGDAKVFYTDISKLSWKKTKRIMESVSYDIIYLNSFFSNKFSTIPYLINKYSRIKKKPIIIAPRGQFSLGALSLKSKKKKAFLKLVKTGRIYKNVIWHATATTEKKDIELVFGLNEKIIVANNLTKDYSNINFIQKSDKIIGELKLIFLSRIHPKKNLLGALDLVRHIKGKIEMNIYGPIEDPVYWSQCEEAIRNMPNNIRVSYKGTIKNEDVSSAFKDHHVFLFPTFGENFGHVISEALIGGCLLIISDQTPWRQLEEKKIGWDINLKNDEKFIEALNICVNLDNEEYNHLSKRCFDYGKSQSNQSKDILQYNALFQGH